MADETISVIIPTLNEEKTLSHCLHWLGETGVEECIVVDGGSSDATKEVAVHHKAQCFTASGSRAIQCNAGASKAHGRILCFLHADTKLPRDWSDQIVEVIDIHRCAGGAFRFGLMGSRLAWRIIEAGVNLRSRLLKLPYGDQAIFVPRDVFTNLGGFRPLPFMEDVDFILRLKSYGRVGIAEGRAITSPRRWEREGVMATTVRNYLVFAGYLLGVNPRTLYRWYARSHGQALPDDASLFTTNDAKRT